MSERKVIVFTRNEELVNFLRCNLSDDMVSSCSFEISLDEIDFAGSLIIVDYDAPDCDVKTFLSDLTRVSGSESKVIVLSENCDSKNIADSAKRGADRFIVKPLTRKRFKRFVLPYIESSG